MFRTFEGHINLVGGSYTISVPPIGQKFWVAFTGFSLATPAFKGPASSRLVFHAARGLLQRRTGRIHVARPPPTVTGHSARKKETAVQMTGKPVVARGDDRW